MKEERQLSFGEARPEPLEAYLERVKNERFPLSLLLCQVEDARNLGSLFRLADSARLQHIYLFGNEHLLENKKFRRVSRSTLPYVPHSTASWEEVQGLARAHTFVGLEITNKSIPYTEYEASEGVILVVGNEKEGISPEVLSLCRQCVHIPMYGVKTSMNVTMAAAIVVYGLLPALQ